MIGFREVLFSVNESVVFVKLYVEFLSPADISSEVEVNVTLFTVDDTAFGEYFYCLWRGRIHQTYPVFSLCVNLSRGE